MSEVVEKKTKRIHTSCRLNFNRFCVLMLTVCFIVWQVVGAWLIVVHPIMIVVDCITSWRGSIVIVVIWRHMANIVTNGRQLVSKVFVILVWLRNKIIAILLTRMFWRNDVVSGWKDRFLWIGNVVWIVRFVAVSVVCDIRPMVFIGKMVKLRFVCECDSLYMIWKNKA